MVGSAERRPTEDGRDFAIRNHEDNEGPHNRGLTLKLPCARGYVRRDPSLALEMTEKKDRAKISVLAGRSGECLSERLKVAVSDLWSNS